MLRSNTVEQVARFPAPCASVTVAIVASYPSTRAGLRALLAGEGIEVVGESSPAGLIAGEPIPPAGVAVVDVGESLGDAAGLLAGALANLPCIVLCGDPADARRLRGQAGAAGVLLRDVGATELRAAVWAVAEGLVVLHPAAAAPTTPPRPGFPETGNEEPLTAREIEVLRLVAGGLPNKGIALALGISEHTVKFHVGSILGKLGAGGRTEAVTAAIRRGLVLL